MRRFCLKLGDGKLSITIVSVGFVLSMSTVVFFPLVEKLCPVPLISYIVMRILEAGVFLLFLAVALLPKHFPLKEIWFAPDRHPLKGRLLRTVMALLGIAVVVEGLCQTISAIFGNFIDAKALNLEISTAAKLFSISDPLSNILLGKHGLVANVVVAPAVEEFIFRGILLNYMLARSRISTSILVTSIIFGLLHGDYLSAFFGAVFWSCIYVIYGQLWLCILLHGFGNLLIMVFFGLGGGSILLSWIENGGNQIFGIGISAIAIIATFVKARHLFDKEIKSAFS